MCVRRGPKGSAATSCLSKFEVLHLPPFPRTDEIVLSARRLLYILFPFRGICCLLPESARHEIGIGAYSIGARAVKVPSADSRITCTLVIVPDYGILSDMLITVAVYKLSETRGCPAVYLLRTTIRSIIKRTARCWI